MAVGEANHLKGADGARRAKKWLDATTRVKASWTNEDEVNINKLSFAWPYGGQTFSFDLGGILSGDEFENQTFVSEVKNYSGVGDQPEHYDDWLAKSYIARQLNPALTDNFMWITWHPFAQTNWKKLCTEEWVEKGILLPKNIERIFGTKDRDDAKAAIDSKIVTDVASRLWVIVLSERQEKLVITGKHRSWLVKKQTKKDSE
ncbi:hypothetical protein ACFVWG_33460 [Kribbella sp. NPDC058245]|uniref:hypothetical protein n=1 Tax=Kribbella sp. NPDC058245 TaxID=3346399 RepID=UPI0036E7E059